MRKVALVLLVTACQSAPQQAATPVSPLPAPAAAPTGPPPDVPALDLPEPKSSFEPATYATGRAPALKKALAGKEKVVLVVGAELGGDDQGKRIFDMIRAVAPQAKVLHRNPDALRVLQVERGERPQEVRAEATGQTDIFGQPTYVLKDVMLQTEWVGKAKKMYGADVLMLFDVAHLDPERRQRFRDLTVGGCDPLLAELDAMRATADAAVGPFSDHVNRTLLARFEELARPQAGTWLDELRPWSDPPRDRLSYEREDDYNKHQCGHAYWRIVNDAVRCAAPGCAEVPSLHVEGGAWVGSNASAVYVAPDCPSRMGTDFLARLREVAAAASRDVAARLPARSGARVAAAGTLVSLRDAVKGACGPARGRVPDDKRAGAAAKVKAVIVALRDVAPAAGDGWIEERAERIAGGGRGFQAARFRSAAVEAAERDAADIGREAKARRCRSTLDDPVAVAAVDVGTSETLYLDYFREEEILCDGMQPIGIGSTSQ
jgi:hypothetical protein